MGPEVTETRDVLHQVEYRWLPMRDLSPVASSLSHESLRGWDPWIRSWVRHPNVGGLGESLCYQIHPAGRAALAWRYKDEQAAERADGARGRPWFSRVLAGQANLLTPEVAIALCRTGLPATAGPRPGQVTPEAEMPVVRGDNLIALVHERIGSFDHEAARQAGLQQVVAAALSDRLTPLAIQVPDQLILKPSAEGPQSPLMWGLRRILWPLLGNHRARLVILDVRTASGRNRPRHVAGHTVPPAERADGAAGQTT